MVSNLLPVSNLLGVHLRAHLRLCEKITFFTCGYSLADKVSEGGGLADEGEDIEVLETDLEQAAAMVAAGEIIDAKTVILIQFLRDRIRAKPPV